MSEEIESLRAEVAALRTEVANLRADAASSRAPLPFDEPLDRRAALRRAGPLAAGAVAGGALVGASELQVGTNVAMVAPLPVGYIEATCRITAVIDEPDAFGFTYGTLSVHPERGEESFIIGRTDDQVRSSSQRRQSQHIRSHASLRRSPVGSRTRRASATWPP